MIERMLASWRIRPAASSFRSVRQTVAFLTALWIAANLNYRSRSDAIETMPSAEADRLAEAVRRALPELKKLDRYERRAAALRDRGLRALKRKKN